jgi:hypothetical protein
MRAQLIMSAAVAFMAWCGLTRECDAAFVTPYQQSCLDAGVPLPPPFGKPKGKPWKFEGTLPPGLIFASEYPTSDVYVYQTDGPPAGVCVALPRSDAAGVIQLLGVICQATSAVQLGGETAPAVHACFWDNLDAKGNRITSTDLTDLNPQLFQGGDELQENCTNCHRGDNAYIVVPDTPESKADKGHVNRNGTPYVPIGQANWLNPPGTLKLSGGCDACHSIPNLLSPDPMDAKNQSLYCSTVLKNFILGVYPPGHPKAGKLLMPPGKTGYTKAQAADVQAIRDACAALGVVF